MNTSLLASIPELPENFSELGPRFELAKWSLAQYFSVDTVSTNEKLSPIPAGWVFLRAVGVGKGADGKAITHYLFSTTNVPYGQVLETVHNLGPVVADCQLQVLYPGNFTGLANWETVTTGLLHFRNDGITKTYNKHMEMAVGSPSSSGEMNLAMYVKPRHQVIAKAMANQLFQCHGMSRLETSKLPTETAQECIDRLGDILRNEIRPNMFTWSFQAQWDFLGYNEIKRTIAGITHNTETGIYTVTHYFAKLDWYTKQQLKRTPKNVAKFMQAEFSTLEDALAFVSHTRLPGAKCFVYFGPAIYIFRETSDKPCPVSWEGFATKKHPNSRAEWANAEWPITQSTFTTNPRRPERFNPMAQVKVRAKKFFDYHKGRPMYYTDVETKPAPLAVAKAVPTPFPVEQMESTYDPAKGSMTWSCAPKFGTILARVGNTLRINNNWFGGAPAELLAQVGERVEWPLFLRDGVLVKLSELDMKSKKQRDAAEAYGKYTV